MKTVQSVWFGAAAEELNWENGNIWTLVTPSTESLTHLFAKRLFALLSQFAGGVRLRRLGGELQRWETGVRTSVPSTWAADRFLPLG